MNERGDAVEVRLASGGTREVDLVIGADGQHSHVRRLVFGPDAEYERDLGIAVCAFDLEGYPHRDVDVAVGHTEVGFQAVRLALRDGGTMFLLTFRHEGPIPVDDPEAQRDIVRRALAGAGGEVPGVLERMPEARTFYFDKALQIRMPAWTRGRVALVGDAGAAPSLLAGQGSALAMVEAYTLAAELDRTGGDHIRAFEAYERRLRPLILSKQDAATGLGVAFAPRSRMQLAVRNAIMKTMAVPFIARLAMGRSLRDQVELPPPAGG
jgi:2-polyprenyl-6-methoxyphenol hydroxylase-like FAD-dependent oxidoreductase